MRSITLSFTAALLAAGLALAAPAAAQQTFASPEDAAKALVDAAKSPEPGMLDRIFGPGAKDLLSSGDAEVDRKRVEDFLALADAGSGKADEPGGRRPSPSAAADGSSRSRSASKTTAGASTWPRAGRSSRTAASAATRSRPSALAPTMSRRSGSISRSCATMSRSSNMRHG